MTLVNARAAFEKAVTDAVAAADNTVLMVYDNVAFTRPGKTKKYILLSVSFGQATLQNQGAAQDTTLERFNATSTSLSLREQLFSQPLVSLLLTG